MKAIIDSAIQAIQRQEDRRAFRALNRVIYSPMEISIQPCIFGHALIATSWRDRLMAVELGATMEELVRNYVNHWNKTSSVKSLFVSNDREPDPKVVDSVLRVINQGGLIDNAVHRNISLGGTMLQRKVWQALLKIPSGTVETYQQIAERIEEPQAVRAIGNAVGANPIAIIVPCHRVVRSDGKMGGYRWGEPIKQKLLEREGVR